ncbi:M1 family aminopeptidase [Polyangium sp. 6x1]|uniref:M1 family metallopeptidase n=1 Tax=Polyangium sp. 6x1 TaxID=3042689 RepID=UPI00248218F4|nr:M1 family aminopeptidase [Polyangium sp. 6x1]MDI1446435.1 M1 family aminopeptidase [Polyangium sp. 6x1]
MQIGRLARHVGMGIVILTALGCAQNENQGESASSSSGTPVEPPPEPSADFGRNIQKTGLTVDLATMTATAVIDLAGSLTSTGASFEAGGLEIESVSRAEGPLKWTLTQGQLDVGVPKSLESAQITIDYKFKEQAQFEGLMAKGSTLVWPYFCGNLFPCHSDPADGTTFDLTVTGTPAGMMTVYPSAIGIDAPSYQIAWATGSYTKLDIGTTFQGTRLVAHYLPGGGTDAQKGTEKLVDIMNFYETMLAGYPFGGEAGPIAADWGPTAYGGMEHHPYWHVSTIAMGDPWIQAHEAAHAWFGDGVRVACWEDFVLSEGTVSYLEARAITEVMGAAEGTKVWSHYQTRLNTAMAGSASKIAWPEGCGAVDILKDNLFGDIAYMKGAFFFRALEAKIGKQKLDPSLKAFFLKNKGKAAHFQDLLDILKSVAGYDAAACAAAWLRSETVPSEQVCP